MRKKAILIPFIFTLFSTTIFAQYPMDIIDVSRTTRDVLYGSRFKDVVGSPFTTENWIIGTLIDNKGTSYENVVYKYDAYNDELMMKTEDEQLFVLGKTQVAKFRYVTNGEQFNYVKVRVSDVEAFKYMRIIYDGKIRFYEHLKKEIQKEQSGYNGYGGGYSPKDEFVDKVKYYLQKTDGVIVEVELKQKSILNVLSQKENELKNFIKVNKTNLKDYQDLVKLFIFYDSL